MFLELVLLLFAFFCRMHSIVCLPEKYEGNALLQCEDNVDDFGMGYCLVYFMKTRWLPTEIEN